MELTRISGHGHVAAEYGLEEAIFLDSIMYWWQTNRAERRNYKEGRYWTYNTINALAKIFPWWTVKQVRRIVDSCKEQGALIAACFNDDARDRTTWYSPGDRLLELYGYVIPKQEDDPHAEDDTAPICPNGQASIPERADLNAQTGTALPCNNHVDTNIPPYNPPTGDGEGEETPKKPRRKRDEPKETADWKPERFEGFWEYYGMKVNRQRAIKEWDKLRPSDDLIDQMSRTLRRQKQSDLWRRGIGIPQPAQWLKDRRWTDQDFGPENTPPPPSGGQVIDLEVM